MAAPRPITRKEFEKLNSRLKGVEKLASTHDPDIMKLLRDQRKTIDALWGWNKNLDDRLAAAEGQLKRIGAPMLAKQKPGKPQRRLKAA